MKAVLNLDLNADEVANVLIPALAAKHNADGKLGKFVQGAADDPGGLAAKVTLEFGDAQAATTGATT